MFGLILYVPRNLLSFEALARTYIWTLLDLFHSEWWCSPRAPFRHNHLKTLLIQVFVWTLLWHLHSNRNSWYSWTWRLGQNMHSFFPIYFIFLVFYTPYVLYLIPAVNVNKNLILHQHLFDIQGWKKSWLSFDLFSVWNASRCLGLYSCCWLSASC